MSAPIHDLDDAGLLARLAEVRAESAALDSELHARDLCTCHAPKNYDGTPASGIPHRWSPRADFVPGAPRI